MSVSLSCMVESWASLLEGATNDPSIQRSSVGYNGMFVSSMYILITNISVLGVYCGARALFTGSWVHFQICAYCA